MTEEVARSGWWRSIFDPVASSSEQATLLSGRMLRIVRAAVLVVLGVAVVVYVADLFTLWDEAHDRKYHTTDPVYGTRQTHDYYGLTVAERNLLGSDGGSPDWYPVYVVVRQALVVTVSVWIAWLIFSRRPRHWMAYLTTLFIALAPLLAYPDQTDDRLAGTTMFVPSEWLTLIAILVFLSFLWTFPDGRFIGSVARYVATAVAVVVGTRYLGALAGALFSWPDGGMTPFSGLRLRQRHQRFLLAC